MEFIVAQVERGVDGLERLKIDIHFFFFAVVCDDRASVHNETVGRDSVVEFEALLGRGDGPEHRLPVHSGFDVRGSSILILKHRLGLSDLQGDEIK